MHLVTGAASAVSTQVDGAGTRENRNTYCEDRADTCMSRPAMSQRSKLCWTFSQAVLAISLGTVSPVAVAQSDRAQPTLRGTDLWAWAGAGQATLRVLALDSARQQVVVKVGDGDLKVVKSGEQITSLAVTLLAASGSTATFLPTGAPGREASIDRISITLGKNGKQSTLVSRLDAPARPIVGGWSVVPQ